MPFNKITEAEKEMFNDLREMYASGASADLEYVLRHWSKAKSDYLYGLFGEKLIVSKEIEFSTPKTTLLKECYDLLHSHPFVKKMKELFNPEYTGKEEDWREGNAYWLLSDYNLVENKVPANNRITNTYFLGDHTFKLNAGMKLMRALKKIVDECGLDEPYTEKATLFEDFRQKHSQILNAEKFRGELCLSIHPLDYATMSMNNNGWTSCMNWNGGDFCQGTVEMMNSSSVVVAYLKSSSANYGIGNHNWNSKKWRELFIIEENAIIAVKPYPYFDESLEKEVFKMIFELIEKNGDLIWKSYEFSKPFVAKNVDGDEVYCEEFDLRVSLGIDNGAMYNDFYDDRMVSLNKCLPNNSYYTATFSGTSECMNCGDDSYDYTDGENENCLMCDNCDTSTHCRCCGCRIADGYARWVDDEPYCDYCFENNVSECKICGELHLDDYMLRVHAYSSKLKMGLVNLHAYICEDCFDSNAFEITLSKEAYFGPYDSRYYVYDIDAHTPEEVEDVFVGYSYEDIVKRFSSAPSHNLLTIPKDN